MNLIWAAHLALLFANIIYGVNYSVAKEVMPAYIQPSGFILLRVSAAVILFYVTSLFFPRQKISLADHKRLFLCGVFGVALNQLLFFQGLSLTTPINAALMMVCTPILVLLISTTAHRESLSWKKTFGVIMGLCGALSLLIKNGRLDLFNGATALGDLCVLLNAASWGLYLVLVKPLMQRYHTVHVIRWVFFYGFLLVIPFGLNQFLTVGWSELPQHILAKTAFVVLATTYVAYLLNTLALKWASPSLVSVYIYLQPFLAATFALWAGTDQLDLPKIVSAVFIFLGISLTSESKAVLKKRKS